MSASDAATGSDAGGAASAPDPMLGALIEALSGTSAVDPLALMRTQLHSRAQDNPQLAQLLQVLAERQRQAVVSEDAPDDDALSDVDAPAADDPSSLANIGDALYGELERLRRRSARLAAALGACRVCFGDDDRCESCDGQGVPGSRTPRPEAFRRYVLPAIRRAREVESGGGRRAPPGARAAVRSTNPHDFKPGYDAQHEHPLEQDMTERQEAP